MGKMCRGGGVVVALYAIIVINPHTALMLLSSIALSSV
jgi:hypothetical protein